MDGRKAGRHKHTEDKERETKAQRRVSSRKWITFFLLTSVFLIVGGWIAIAVAGHALIEEERLALAEKTVLRDRGEARVPAEDSEYARIDDMPDYVWQAFVAIEDHRFQHHFGVDLQALARSVWVNVKEGRKAQGGSTITMQLARNLFLTHDKTYTRKLKEMIIAINLEGQYTKEELLDIYLNQIYFGHGNYGIEAAANFYFGKTVLTQDPEQDTLTLSEAAMLAALAKAPEYYSPVKHLEKALNRRDIVLNRMEEVGFISEEAVQTAQHTEIEIVSDGHRTEQVETDQDAA